MHIIIVTHDNSLPVLGATSVIPAERYSSPYPFLIGVQAEFKVMGAGRSNSYRTCTLSVRPPPLKEFVYGPINPTPITHHQW